LVAVLVAVLSESRKIQAEAILVEALFHAGFGSCWSSLERL